MASHAARLLAPLLIAASAVVLTASPRNSMSITYDETFYLREGIKTLHGGALDGDLARLGVAPLPIALNLAPGVWLAGANADHDVYAPRPGNRRLIAIPRLLTTLTTLVPLVLLAFGWLNSRRGLAAAILGAGMLATSPSLLAHASIAGTDAAFATLATLATLAIGLYLQSPSRFRLVLAGAATGLAFSTKYTGVLLLPCFLIGRSLDLARSRRATSGPLPRHITRFILDVIGFLAIGLLTAWACHGFQIDPNQRWRGVPPPTFISSFEHQMTHNRIGHPSFYHGSRSWSGWWSYYPYAMLVKSTLPELTLAAAGVLVALRGLRSLRRGGLGVDRQRATLLWFIAITAAALIASPICIGHRYALVLYPMIVLLSVDALSGAVRNVGWSRCLGATLLGGQIVTCLFVTPHYLSYFNPLFGGPATAWNRLSDSNIDWGQDLPALRTILDREGYRTVVLDYFGTAAPTDYGIEADAIDAPRRPLDEYDALAVSVTQLQSIYRRPGETRRPTPDVYRILRGHSPTFRAGGSIFVYDLGRPEIREAFVAAVHEARPSAVQAAAREGSASARR